MERKQWITVGVVIALVCVAAGAIILSSNDDDNTLIVETSPDFAPFDYMLSGEYVGIDMDIVRAIANDMGVNVEFRTNNFDSILLSVPQGKADVGASGFTYSEERAQSVLFSDTYAQVKQVIVTHKDNHIDSMEELKGKILVVQNSTTGHTYAEELVDKGGAADVRVLTNYSQVVQDVLQKGTYEVVDSLVAQSQVMANSDLEICDVLDAEIENYGFIFAKNNTELCEKFNQSLENIKESGEYQRIFDYYAAHNYSTDTPSYYNQDATADEDVDHTGFWGDLYDTFYNNFIKNDRYQYIFEGLKNTIIIAILALVIGLGLGALVAMVRSTHDITGRFRIANGVCKAYTTVIRGTPVMLQLLIIYYVIFATSHLNSVLIASVAFGINSGAYVAEVVRSGINAVPKGQMEACRSLGMSSRMAMITVILPQAIRNILPALGNESISLLKETSIAGYIGIMDLTKGVDIIRGQTYDALPPLLVAGAIYLAIVMVLAYLFSRLERRLNDAY